MMTKFYNTLIPLFILAALALFTASAIQYVRLTHQVLPSAAVSASGTNRVDASSASGPSRLLRRLDDGVARASARMVGLLDEMTLKLKRRAPLQNLAPGA